MGTSLMLNMRKYMLVLLGCVTAVEQGLHLDRRIVKRSNTSNPLPGGQSAQSSSGTTGNHQKTAKPFPESGSDESKLIAVLNLALKDGNTNEQITQVEIKRLVSTSFLNESLLFLVPENNEEGQHTLYEVEVTRNILEYRRSDFKVQTSDPENKTITDRALENLQINKGIQARNEVQAKFNRDTIAALQNNPKFQNLLPAKQQEVKTKAFRLNMIGYAPLEYELKDGDTLAGTREFYAVKCKDFPKAQCQESQLVLIALADQLPEIQQHEAGSKPILPKRSGRTSRVRTIQVDDPRYQLRRENLIQRLKELSKESMSGPISLLRRPASYFGEFNLQALAKVRFMYIDTDRKEVFKCKIPVGGGSLECKLLESALPVENNKIVASFDGQNDNPWLPTDASYTYTMKTCANLPIDVRNHAKNDPEDPSAESPRLVVWNLKNGKKLNTYYTKLVSHPQGIFIGLAPWSMRKQLQRGARWLLGI